MSFIASSASNIPKIARSIEKMSGLYGDALTFGGMRVHAFPTPEALARADLAGLRACELGYRARYVRDAARAVAEGQVDLAAVAKLDTADAQRALVEGLDGVGPKVAACALLFSMGKDDAFPVDRWVQRCVSEWYLRGRKINARRCEEWGRDRFGRTAGYAQQYLFHDARQSRLKTRRLRRSP
jgi:N-glycosylase/DNA lyase